jgi:hypothetical protein
MVVNVALASTDAPNQGATGGRGLNLEIEASSHRTTLDVPGEGPHDESRNSSIVSQACRLAPPLAVMLLQLSKEPTPMRVCQIYLSMAGPPKMLPSFDA